MVEFKVLFSEDNLSDIGNDLGSQETLKAMNIPMLPSVGIHKIIIAYSSRSSPQKASLLKTIFTLDITLLTLELFDNQFSILIKGN